MITSFFMLGQFKIFNRIDNVDSKKLFTASTAQHLRDHNNKLFREHTRTQLRSNFFSSRVVTHWNELPEHVVKGTWTNIGRG